MGLAFFNPVQSRPSEILLCQNVAGASVPVIEGVWRLKNQLSQGNQITKQYGASSLFTNAEEFGCTAYYPKTCRGISLISEKKNASLESSYSDYVIRVYDYPPGGLYGGLYDVYGAPQFNVNLCLYNTIILYPGWNDVDTANPGYPFFVDYYGDSKIEDSGKEVISIEKLKKWLAIGGKRLIVQVNDDVELVFPDDKSVNLKLQVSHANKFLQLMGSSIRVGGCFNMGGKYPDGIDPTGRLDDNAFSIPTYKDAVTIKYVNGGGGQGGPVTYHFQTCYYPLYPGGHYLAKDIKRFYKILQHYPGWETYFYPYSLHPPHGFGQEELGAGEYLGVEDGISSYADPMQSGSVNFNLSGGSSVVLIDTGGVAAFTGLVDADFIYKNQGLVPVISAETISGIYGNSEIVVMGITSPFDAGSKNPSSNADNNINIFGTSDYLTNAVAERTDDNHNLLKNRLFKKPE